MAPNAIPRFTPGAVLHCAAEHGGLAATDCPESFHVEPLRAIRSPHPNRRSTALNPGPRDWRPITSLRSVIRLINSLSIVMFRLVATIRTPYAYIGHSGK